MVIRYFLETPPAVRPRTLRWQKSTFIPQKPNKLLSQFQEHDKSLLTETQIERSNSSEAAICARIARVASVDFLTRSVSQPDNHPFPALVVLIELEQAAIRRFIDKGKGLLVKPYVFLGDAFRYGFNAV